jgi:hypothetical protein
VRIYSSFDHPAAHAGIKSLWPFPTLVISFFISDIKATEMIRTVISLDSEDKAWLDRTARQEHTPMTRLVRRAIQRLRKESESSPSRFDVLLRETSGIWKLGEGLAYQRRLRREWDRRK